MTLDFMITAHAAFEMQRRGITADDIHGVMMAPEQSWEIRPGRVVRQSRLPMGSPAKMFLLRVFVDVDRQPVEVVTVYRTTKIEKYWRDET